jgi:hypothetical protein
VTYRTHELDREGFRTGNRPYEELFVGWKTTFCAYVKAEHGWNKWVSPRRAKASRIIIRSLIIIICTNKNGRHSRSNRRPATARNQRSLITDTGSRVDEPQPVERHTIFVASRDSRAIRHQTLFL